MRPKIALAGLLALALVAPTGAAAPIVNQIDNGGFEDFEDDEPTEWRLLDGEVTRTSDAHEGDSAARLNTVGDSQISAIGQNVSLDREDAPTVPNATYDFDFAAILDQGADTQPTTPPDARAKVLWKNALGEVTEVNTVEIQPSADYVTYNVTLEAPVDAVEAEIQFELERTSDTARTDSHVNVDDVAFGPAVPV